MIKNIKTVLLVLFSISILGCGTGKKGSNDAKNSTFYDQVLKNGSAPQETGKKIELTGKPTEKLGSWVKEGAVCYGIVMLTSKTGKPTYGMPVKAKVIKIESNRVKMETLEDLNLGDKRGCSKMNFPSGSTWWETEGQIFKDRKEAFDFLKESKLLK